MKIINRATKIKNQLIPSAKKGIITHLKYVDQTFSKIKAVMKQITVFGHRLMPFIKG